MSRFDDLARKTALGMGHPAAFFAASGSVLFWAGIGPAMGFSDTWQLWCNTATTIVTFLMVFLIQASQNRDSAALQAKLDELIRALPDADDNLRGIEQAATKERGT
jgi:low affinity Fe/Cu permease